MLRDLRWVSLVETFSRISSLVTVPLLTRALLPEQYGIYKAIFIVFSVFFLLKGVANFGTVLQKRLPEIEEREQAGFVVATLAGVGGVLAISWLLLAVAVELSLVTIVSSPLQSFLERHLLLVGALFLATPLYRTTLDICRGIDQFEWYSAVKSIREGVFLAAVLGLFWTDTLTVRTALVALLLASIGAFGFGVWVIRSRLASAPNFDALKEQLRSISLPLAPKILLKKASGAIPDAIVIGAFGPSVFAAWSVVFVFTSVFQFVSGPFSQLFLPKISGRHAEGRPLAPIVVRYYRVMGVFVAPAVVGGWLLGPEIIQSVFGGEYFYGVVVTGVLLTNFGVQTLNTLSGHFFIGTDKSLYETYNHLLYTAVLIPAAVLGGLTEILLIVALGYLAANTSSLVFSLWYQQTVIYLEAPPASSLLRVAVALITMSVGVVAVEPHITSLEMVVAAVGLGAAIYFTTLVSVGFVSEDDITLVRRFIGLQ